MASRVIGVTGKKRHGKDTFAARLTSTHAFTRLAFADPMREALYGLDPLVLVDFDNVGPLREATGGVEIFQGAGTYRLTEIVDRAGWEAAKSLREVRRLLQEYGTGLRRTLGDAIWVRATASLVADVRGPVVITDVRFPNEADYIKSVGGILVRVVRPSLAFHADGTEQHISETALDGYPADKVVYNGSTIEALNREADAVVHSLYR